MAKLEGEVRAAHAERAKAREKARQALRDLEPEPEPEPVEEEDSISAILFDIIDEIGERIAGPRREPGVNDLIDGLDDLSSRLDRKPSSGIAERGGGLAARLLPGGDGEDDAAEREEHGDQEGDEGRAHLPVLRRRRRASQKFVEPVGGL